MTMLDHNSPAAIAETGVRGSLFEEIRTVLKRPDLSDDVLANVLGTPPAALVENPDTFGAIQDCGNTQTRADAIRLLAVPAPSHGLDMPTHDLNPPLAVRFAPLAARLQRALQIFAPQLKRMPAPARVKEH